MLVSEKCVGSESRGSGNGGGGEGEGRVFVEQSIKRGRGGGAGGGVSGAIETLLVSTDSGTCETANVGAGTVGDTDTWWVTLALSDKAQSCSWHSIPKVGVTGAPCTDLQETLVDWEDWCIPWNMMSDWEGSWTAIWMSWGSAIFPLRLVPGDRLGEGIDWISRNEDKELLSLFSKNAGFFFCRSFLGLITCNNALVSTNSW